MPVEEKLDAQAGGSHARWVLSAENHHKIREAIQGGGMLTRALFDAMDTKRDGQLCRAELENGIQELLKDEHARQISKDCIVVDVAKKCAFEMAPDEFISFGEFERRTKLAYQEMTTLDMEYDWP